MRRLRCPKLNKVESPLSKEVEYLGVTVDQNWTWGPHLNKVKAKIALGGRRTLCGKNWGLNSWTNLFLYKMVIRPMITYGSVAWGEKVMQTVTNRQL